MKRWALILAISFQVLVLAFMAGKREYISATGTVVYLRTAPIDPRDIFRGDYVRLRYEASMVPLSLADDAVQAMMHDRPRGETVYASLAVGENGLADVTALTATPPSSGPFLRGRLSESWRFGSSGRGQVAVAYGIEAYFVQQGKGIEIEKQRGGRTTVQTPLEMEVALGSGGTAVIRGHRWSPLGIGLQAVESARRDRTDGRKSAKLRLTLQNVSDRPLAIIDLPGSCSFFLEPFSPDQAAQPPARPACDGIVPTDEQVVVLAPQEGRSFDIDLADPAWHVLQGGALVEAGPLPWSERFRLVYQPPSAQASAHLKDAALIRHGSLPSRAFHGQGNID